MSSVSELPVTQESMQSCLVSVSYLSDRTQCSHAKCQCGTCHTGLNAVMSSVSELPVRQDTMQSCLVSVWYLSYRTMQSYLVSVSYLSYRTQCSHV